MSDKITKDEYLFILMNLGNEKFIRILASIRFTDTIKKKIAELESSTAHASDLDFSLNNATAQRVNQLQYLRTTLEEAHKHPTVDDGVG